MSRRYTQVKFISTRILQQIIDSAPYYTTDVGTEYFDQADEIREVLWEREQKKADKEMRDFENREVTYKKHIADEQQKKWCPKCDEIKELDDFSNRSDYKHLKRSHCKDCNNEHVKNNRVPF